MRRVLLLLLLLLFELELEGTKRGQHSTSLVRQMHLCLLLLLLLLLCELCVCKRCMHLLLLLHGLCVRVLQRDCSWGVEVGVGVWGQA